MPRQVASVVRGSVLRSRVLSLAKTCSIGLRSGELARQEEQLGASGADQLANHPAFVAAEIVHDHDVAGGQGRHQELLDIGAEAGAVDRPVDNAGCGDPVATQGGQKGQGAPSPVRHLGDQASAAGAAPMSPGHVGLGPGLVDKHQALRVKPVLVLFPPGAAPGDVGPVLLAGVQAFF